MLKRFTRQKLGTECKLQAKKWTDTIQEDCHQNGTRLLQKRQRTEICKCLDGKSYLDRIWKYLIHIVR